MLHFDHAFTQCPFTFTHSPTLTILFRVITADSMVCVVVVRLVHSRIVGT
jgi:hypothetical protein